MENSIELYKNDYVILLSPNFDEFARFQSGEIIIYDDLQQAHQDAKEWKGVTATCTGIFPLLQGILMQNIRTYRIRNNIEKNKNIQYYD